MTKQLKSKPTTEAKYHLYVGTTEQEAKEAPIKGLKPPVVLSDVYPGYFAFSASKDANWGIVEVNMEALLPDNLAPFSGRKKQKWRDSLKECGVCLYMLHIPVHAITKVTVYSPNGRVGNSFITESVKKNDPLEVTLAQHQATYALNLGLTRWLACELVTGTELMNGSAAKQGSKIDDLLANRNGLELFYRRTEKDFHSWWKL